MISTIQTVLTPHELLLDCRRDALIYALVDIYGYEETEFDGLTVSDIAWMYLTEEQCLEVLNYIDC